MCCCASEVPHDLRNVPLKLMLVCQDLRMNLTAIKEKRELARRRPIARKEALKLILLTNRELAPVREAPPPVRKRMASIVT